jgi:type II secretory pathway pseudopilin PulG
MSGMETRGRSRSECGFTVIELLVYFVIAVIVIAGVYQLLIGQNRLYVKQRELQDVRTSVRAAANLLAFELRAASAANGDLYMIDSDSFAIRSIQGTGVICGEHANQPKYGLSEISGEFFDTEDDSALVFAAGEVGSDDDTWKVVHQDNVQTAPAGGVSRCGWGDKGVGKGKGLTKGTGPVMNGRGVPDWVITIVGDMDDVYLGAPYRAFRRTTYGTYQEDGRWWLGRRVGSSSTWERLTGPLRAPTDSGLHFIYYDQSGTTTSTVADVRMVDIILRGESLGKVPQPGEAPDFQQDTLTIRVSLRG